LDPERLGLGRGAAAPALIERWKWAMKMTQDGGIRLTKTDDSRLRQSRHATADDSRKD